MEVEKEKTGPCQYKLTIKVEPERLRQPLRRAAQQISKRRPIAGFRPGRAPYAMVERVYGQEVIVDEMLAEVGNELYQEALEQSQIEPYTRAGFEIVQVDPLILEVTVPAEPEVTLGEYATIRVTQEQPSVTETEVEEVLSQLQDDQALWVPVERAIQMADQIQIDALGTTDDGRKVEQPDLTLEISEGMVPSGFGEQLLGIKPGESKEFDVDYPADFRDENVAGKTVHFQVT
ncbi:MAG: trigger factor, partial [Anaerolineales bacterium]